MLFFVVNFLKCVATEVLFTIVVKTLTFHKIIEIFSIECYYKFSLNSDSEIILKVG